MRRTGGFLDEIGEMDVALQAKLLRVLQERRVLAVGEDREVPVDVRVIAASNRSLSEAVTLGTFRSDLFHRLNVLPLAIPPLRERREDIEVLVEYILEERRSVTGKPVPSPSREFVNALQTVELHGSVRELMNLVHHALANHRSDAKLELQDLKPEVWAEIAERQLAFTLGQLSGPRVTDALAGLASRHPGDHWFRIAGLTSVRDSPTQVRGHRLEVRRRSSGIPETSAV